MEKLNERLLDLAVETILLWYVAPLYLCELVGRLHNLVKGDGFTSPYGDD